ncbi:MAG: hypothetical protein KAG61_04975 [Bacteriovoracaceae bacterium]|nr:hypothetical protein [Bacteriovoracaceae bacterium]
MFRFLNTMLPDNVEEFALVSLLGTTIFLGYAHYRKKLKEVGDCGQQGQKERENLKEEYQNIIKEMESNFKKRESDLLEKLKKRSLSDDSIDFLRGLK